MDHRQIKKDGGKATVSTAMAKTLLEQLSELFFTNHVLYFCIIG